jgi:tetratricopeptide (TPR) repeat protein
MQWNWLLFYEAHNQLGIAPATQGASRMPNGNSYWLRVISTNVEPLLVSHALPGRRRAGSLSRQAAAVKPTPVLLRHSSASASPYKAAQLDRAETALKRALDLAPKMGNVRLMLANVYLKLRRYDRTLDELDKYIAENPKGEQVKEAQQMREQLTAALSSQRP